MVVGGTLHLYEDVLTAAPCCCPRCKGCAFPTNVLGPMQVQLGGWGGSFYGGGGTSVPCFGTVCADWLNKTFILDRWEYDHPGAGENGDRCQWVYLFDDDPCINIPDILWMETQILSGHYLLSIRLQADLPGVSNANWQIDLGTTAPDCSAFSGLVVPFASENFPCTYDGSPAIVTAL